MFKKRLGQVVSHFVFPKPPTVTTSEWFYSVVVITSALHAEGPGFNPQWNQSSVYLTHIFNPLWNQQCIVVILMYLGAAVV